MLIPLLIGVGLGDLLHGLPINQHHDFTGNFFDLLTGYGLMTGVTLLALCLLHGATFLALRTTDEIRDRARAAGRVDRGGRDRRQPRLGDLDAGRDRRRHGSRADADLRRDRRDLRPAAGRHRQRRVGVRGLRLRDRRRASARSSSRCIPT